MLLYAATVSMQLNTINLQVQQVQQVQQGQRQQALGLCWTVLDSCWLWVSPLSDLEALPFEVAAVEHIYNSKIY